MKKEKNIIVIFLLLLPLLHIVSKVVYIVADLKREREKKIITNSFVYNTHTLTYRHTHTDTLNNNNIFKK